MAFAWDVAYCNLYDHFAVTTPALRQLSASISFFIVPIVVCGTLGFLLKQWRAGTAGAFAFMSCVAAPFLMILPAFAFMCAVFNSCFGD